MSISAIHKRIRRLEDDGIITAYIARPSIIALKYLWVAIFGTSKAKSMDIVSKELGQHDWKELIGWLLGAGIRVVWISYGLLAGMMD